MIDVGVPTKGMPAWGPMLGATRCVVTAYLLTLKTPTYRASRPGKTQPSRPTLSALFLGFRQAHPWAGNRNHQCANMNTKPAPPLQRFDLTGAVHIHPLDVKGFMRARRWIFALLIGAYLAAPVVPSGRPAIHLDVSESKVLFIGASFNAQISGWFCSS